MPSEVGNNLGINPETITCEKNGNPENKYLHDVDFEDALDRTGFGKYNLILTLICGMTLFGVNCEAYAVGYVLPSAECDLNLDLYRKGVISSVNFIGLTASCCLWGYLADTKGRKNLLIVCLTMTFLSSVAAVFTPSYWGFAVFRLLNGIFLSGPSAVVYAYFGEFQGRIYRSKATAWTSFFIALGLIFLPGLGWALLRQPANFEIFGIFSLTSWRIYMLIVSLSNMVVALAFVYLPESPKFLYHNGKTEEALEILRRVYSVNTGLCKDDFVVKSLRPSKMAPVENIIQDAENNTKKDSKSLLKDLFNQIVPLFKVPHLKYMLAACTIQAGVFAISSGLLLWYPDIIKQVSMVHNGSNRKNDTRSFTVCQTLSMSHLKAKNEEEVGITSLCQQNLDDQIFIQNLIIGGLYCVGYAVWAFLVNLMGNRNFFVLCMIISSTTLFLINFITQNLLIDLLFVISLTLPGICVAVVTLSVMDVIPTHLCGMALCMVISAGRLGSVISSSIIGLVLEWNCTVTFYLFSLSLIVCLLLMLIFPGNQGSKFKSILKNLSTMWT